VFLDQARRRSVSSQHFFFLWLVADAEESASCDGGWRYAYPPYAG
jgi:hypothetical protein